MNPIQNPSLFFMFIFITLTHQVVVNNTKSNSVTPASFVSTRKSSTKEPDVTEYLAVANPAKILPSINKSALSETNSSTLLPISTSSSVLFSISKISESTRVENNTESNNSMHLSSSAIPSSVLTSSHTFNISLSPINSSSNGISSPNHTVAITPVSSPNTSTNSVLPLSGATDDLITSTEARLGIPAELSTGTSTSSVTADFSSSMPTPTTIVTEIIQHVLPSEDNASDSNNTIVTNHAPLHDMSAGSASTARAATTESITVPLLTKTSLRSESRTAESVLTKGLSTTASESTQQTTRKGKSRKRPGVIAPEEPVLSSTGTSTSTKITVKSLISTTSPKTLKKSSTSKITVLLTSKSPTLRKVSNSTTLSTEANKVSIIVKDGVGRTIGYLSVIIAVLMFFSCCFCRYNKRRKYGKLRQYENYRDEDEFLMNSKGKRGMYQSDRFRLLDDESEDELL